MTLICCAKTHEFAVISEDTKVSSEDRLYTATATKILKKDDLLIGAFGSAGALLICGFDRQAETFMHLLHFEIFLEMESEVSVLVWCLLFAQFLLRSIQTDNGVAQGEVNRFDGQIISLQLLKFNILADRGNLEELGLS